MRSRSAVAKWGNSLAIRIPLALARQAGVREGDSVSLALSPEGAIVLRPGRPRYELRELVNGIRRKNLHTETDWGPPQGKESW